MDHPRVRWGILGTGRIAGAFAGDLPKSATGELVAVGSREAGAAKKFADRFGARRAHSSYEALLVDREVDAVYIAVPHPMHHDWAIRAAKAGKQILCEKPLGMNLREAEEMFAAANAAGVMLMEAFMYRCHPQMAQAVELVRNGTLGTVRAIQATFSFYTDFDRNSRMWSPELGGGGILDVGCYPISFSRLIAGATLGRPYAEPVDLKALGTLHPETQVDSHTAAVLKFENGLIAQVATGVGIFQESGVRVYGTKGWFQMDEPWVPGIYGRDANLVLHRPGQPPQNLPVPQGLSLYALEADAFARAWRSGNRAALEMSPGDTLGNLRALDWWRAEIGLSYQADKQSVAK